MRLIHGLEFLLENGFKMKKLKNKYRLISFLLSTVLVFQSCRVYHKESVSLTEAIQSEKRVKIKTSSNKTLKFSKLTFEDGKYYGINFNQNSGKYQKIPLDENKLQTIRLQNKPLSIILGIAIPIVTFVGLVFLAILRWSGPNIGEINFTSQM